MGVISVMTALLVGMIIALAPIAAGNAFGLGKHTGFGHGVNVHQPAFIHKTKIVHDAPLAKTTNSFALGNHTGFGHRVNVLQLAFIDKTKIVHDNADRSNSNKGSIVVINRVVRNEVTFLEEHDSTHVSDSASGLNVQDRSFINGIKIQDVDRSNPHTLKVTLKRTNNDNNGNIPKYISVVAVGKDDQHVAGSTTLNTGDFSDTITVDIVLKNKNTKNGHLDKSATVIVWVVPATILHA
jgi:hypothetical protein